MLSLIDSSRNCSNCSSFLNLLYSIKADTRLTLTSFVSLFLHIQQNGSTDVDDSKMEEISLHNLIVRIVEDGVVFCIRSIDWGC